ncbi:MAG: protein-L-isoaspartate O-methyltransferase [Rhodospirillaceae bacterium]|jgi:protein-L-isoaspartate(D-aspartate) O-methyltransferase
MDYAEARLNMVENQIRTNRVTDPLIIKAMGELPREAFVPGEKAGIAYIDEDIEIAPGRYLMEPMVLARLLQAAEITESDVVLDIGCGTGYASAVLSHMANTVVALESDAGLAAQATETLSALEIDTVAVVEGALSAGAPKQAPYDVIFIGGAVAEVPQAIAGQLAEGGRLVAVTNKKSIGTGALITNHRGILTRRDLFDAATPFLPGFEPAPEFVF